MADRGFTAHEFLSDFNLYNMNGRLYDPVVGRFLSPDPYITDPSFSQSYNRYSYCLNNPLKFIDYSGESWKSFWNKIGNWLTRNNIQFQVGYNSTFGPGFSIGDNPMYYPGYENKIVDGQQNISNQIAGFSGWDGYTMPELSLPTEGFVGESPLANGVASSDGGTPWYSIYNWPALGSSARTMDALYAGDYVSATGYFLTCAAEVFTLGYSSGIKVSSQVVTTTAKTSTALATKYPANAAIAGTTERTFLMPGQVIDRYGALGGKWFSTPGTSYGARSIPPGYSPYTQFKVLKPFEVQKSLASPGFFGGQTGFGIQFQSPVGADILIKRRIIAPY
jgi:RHS repeat-associated protein